MERRGNGSVHEEKCIDDSSRRYNMEYLVKMTKGTHLKLKRSYFEDFNVLGNQQRIHKEVTTYSVLHSPKTMKETSSNTPKHFKTLSLDESRSPNFDLFSDQEEYSEEEVAETMAETMEQYMRKTRADYGSGVARPKIEDKDNFKLKGQFLKELRDNTFSGSDHEDANEHIEKVLKIVDLFHIPNITIDQVMLSKYFPPARIAKKMEEINNFQQESDENLYQAWERFKELLMKCPQHYLTEMEEVVLFYNGLDVLTRQILDSRGSIPSKTAADAKNIQQIPNNLGREIKKVNEKVYAAQVGCEQCKGPHYTKDFSLKEEGKTIEEAYYTQFGVPFQGGGYRATALGFYQRNNANPSKAIYGRYPKQVYE
ncbi:reverse transcriptase domain-containing protein [Tanacetum coccineum]|uniref:Reverse transcriptase domain-containing protein n=1 Tax=Tanacetum coccineum TaxID=301880 RepID=A0ABQ5ACS8_9ASTR